LQSLVLIFVGGLCAWLYWRERRTRSIMQRTADALRTHEAVVKDELGLGNAPQELRSLIRSVLDSASEANLKAESHASLQRFLEALLNQIEDALVVLDENLEIRFSNRAAESMFGIETPHSGRSLIEVCRDHRIVDTVTLSLEIGSKTQDYVQRKPISSTGNRERPRPEHTYLIEAEPLEGVGAVGGAWLLARDVTERLETEQIRRDFVANASHELRTPLSIINGYLEMLGEESTPDPAVLKRAVKTMTTHTDRIIRTVDDMLTISRLESTESLLNEEDFDLADCVLQTIEQLQPIITRQQAKVEVDLPEAYRPFHGDRFYWNQIFFNLIENALKQNSDRIVKIRIVAGAHASRRTIDISDNGVGIPAADLPLIFKRFYRVDKHHSQARKGTGLGLSIVKRAIEAHHGTISVTSKPGDKTTFKIEVPQPDSVVLPTQPTT